MDIQTHIAPLRESLASHRAAGRRIGFVPTMGALHDGHLRLVDVARSHADTVVMSIFVNPLQFRPGEDFDAYPRTFERDRELAESRDVTLLFAPDVAEMYGTGDELRVVPGETAMHWEGATRPGHFEGVLTVMTKLLNIVAPEVVVFGQKDYQQSVLMQRLVTELAYPVVVKVVATAREPDGLAMSSRNALLSPEGRRVARALPDALRAVQRDFASGERSAAALEQTAQTVLEAEPGVLPDYVAVAHPTRLSRVDTAEAGHVVMLAARVGSTRLIDNVILGESLI